MLNLLPEELLVHHILARLDLAALRSCLSTCKRLNRIIKSSALINYSIKLKEMNIIDNPAVSYNEIPLNKRLKMLREYSKRGIRGKASAGVAPGQLGHSRSIQGDAGVIYVVPYYDLDVHELHWTTMPSKANQAVEWNVLRPSNPSATIVAHALSIGENDLLAFATWHETPNSLRIQIHLIRHSIQRPYPGLSSAILDICAFQRLEEYDRPLVNLAIRGTNLAVMVGHNQGDLDESDHLSVWNWKTGEKKCEKLHTPDYRMSLVFLREDILLHASPLDLSLELYHIPLSTGDCDPPLLERLGLPRLKKELECDSTPIPRIIFADNPAAVPSFTEPSNPKATRLFTADNLSSILPIEVMIMGGNGHWTLHLFIVHHHTLLGRADLALSRRDTGQDSPPRSVRWEEWGPEVTRVFWYYEQYLSFLSAPCGSQLFMQRDNVIEVYDFGRAGLKNSQRPCTFGNQGNDPACQSNWFQDGVHTKLPFVYQSFEGSILGNVRDWNHMYVDQSGIVGIKRNGEIEVLYIG